MAIIQNKILIYDYETGSADPFTTEPVEVAALVLDPRTLEPIEGATFESLMRPEDMSVLQDEALAVNNISREEIEAAPAQKEVFADFARFCKKYNSKGNPQWARPLSAGHNIIAFDNIITRRMCERYNLPYLFHPTHFIDTLNLHYLFFENQPEPSKYSLNYLRPYYGLSEENAHRALADVEICAKLIQRFLGFTRRITEKNKDKFKGAFNESA